MIAGAILRAGGNTAGISGCEELGWANARPSDEQASMTWRCRHSPALRAQIGLVGLPGKSGGDQVLLTQIAISARR
jgi:hypothetical protein